MEKLESLIQWGIALDEIPPEGISFSFENLSDFDNDLKVIKPFSGHLKIIKRGFEVEVSGHLEGSLEVICDRCLESFEYPIKEDFKVLLIPKASLNIQEEKELSADDLEVSFYENSFISYYEILKEELYLSLPYRILCKEDCKGLCPVCGTNLNKNSCQCAKIKKSSPFAVLKDFLKDKEKISEKGV